MFTDLASMVTSTSISLMILDIFLMILMDIHPTQCKKNLWLQHLKTFPWSNLIMKASAVPVNSPWVSTNRTSSPSDLAETTSKSSNSVRTSQLQLVDLVTSERKMFWLSQKQCRNPQHLCSPSHSILLASKTNELAMLAKPLECKTFKDTSRNCNQAKTISSSMPITDRFVNQLSILFIS